MGPIATSLLEQAGYELDQPNNRHVIVRSAVLDLHDDDEVMTNNLPMIHTSTERLNWLEEEVRRTRDLVRVCLRRITDVSLSVDDLKPVVAAVEATVTRWTGGQ